MEKLKNFWRVLKQPNTKKALLVILGVSGVNPELATAIGLLIEQTDSVVQAGSALFAGAVATTEIFRDEESKKDV
jgi:hypothetical protein